MNNLHERLKSALAKPIPEDAYSIGDNVFDPWSDIIQGIHGSYSSESDDLMIEAMEAVRDRSTFVFIDQRGFAGEFALYVLSGHGLLEYGTSPRGGWPDHEITDLWDTLIAKWKEYRAVVWRNT